MLRTVLYLLALTLTSVDSCSRGGWRRRPNRREPMLKGEVVPRNTDELDVGASGPAEGVIWPRSKDYENKLIYHTNDDGLIVFRNDEGTLEDLFMTKNCKDKVDALAKLVHNNWEGEVLLRVTEAWVIKDRSSDQRGQGHHAADSLHYEGRAVDITTSDTDRGKLGKLGRLAVNAGFDWVYYAGKNHIHASVKADSKANNDWTGCFKDTNYVTTESGNRKLLRNVVIGDKVLSGSSDGHGVYSEVISFLDRGSSALDFVQVSLADGSTIDLTPSHLIYVDTYTGKQALFASRLQPGSKVFRIANGTETTVRVTTVTSYRSSGFSAPLTSNGDIVVQGVQCSCYALMESHSLAHAALAPLRISAWFSHLVSPVTSSEGVPLYANVLHSLGRLLLPNSLFYS